MNTLFYNKIRLCTVSSINYNIIYTLCLLIILLLFIIAITKKNIKAISIIIIIMLFYILLIGKELLYAICRFILDILLYSNTVILSSIYKNFIRSNPLIRIHHNFKKLSSIKHPVIFMANYPHHWIEYSIVSNFPNTMLLASTASTRIFIPNDQLIFIPLQTHKNNFNRLRDQVKNMISNNKSLYAYMEKPPRNYVFKSNSFRTGLFYMAKEFNIPIIPVVVDHLIHLRGIPVKQNFRILIGNSHYVKDPIKSIKFLRGYFDYVLERFLTVKFT